MTFGERLAEHKDAIVQRWLDDVLGSYSADASGAFKRQKDPFANPVGHSLRAGTRGIFELLLDGADAEAIRPHLEEIIRIRAIQQFSASQAVGFVFRLKEAVRAELGETVVDPACSSDWAELETWVDQVALTAFEIFVECRERVCELRINEVKRSVAWVMDKMNGRNGTPASTRLSPE